ncbi:MAG: DMT famliy transporter [Roseibaca calidilacus]|uniref:DMT famliy transporter n=1 Tax=Roseibaca calidilacus TaxID=1666912 RepID=A0A0P7YRA7_9RHOB|nr:DMT family transporter [Roseibaca calidilacus]KPP92844.1 MAG: DMT famliy transporter [Roseibaca calidilacus]CUX80084.1 EamA domain-containing membrane protein RarD [Roseibaca calidilacus]
MRSADPRLAMLPGDETLGILLRIAATLAFAVMGVCIKALGPAVPLGQVVFFRSAFALIPLIAFLWWSGIFPSGLTTTRPLGHIFRCLMGAAAMFTSFATIRLLPLAEATMLSYLAPALMALMGWALLGERLGLRRLGGVAMGLAGGVVFGLPALSGNLPHGSLLGVALGVLTAVLTAGALIQVRRLTILGEGAGAIAFWFAVVSALAGAATLPLGWVQPDGLQLALLLGAGLAGGVAHILMTLSFRHAEAAALAPFEYLSVLWAVVLGVMIFAELPGWSFVMAAPLILGGAFVASPVGKKRKPRSSHNH